MTSVLRVHASAQSDTIERVRRRLASFSEVRDVVVSPGELVGDTIEIVLVECDLDPLRDGEIRAAVLEELERPAGEEDLRGAISRLEAELAVLRGRVEAGEGTRPGPVQVYAMHEPARNGTA